MKKMTVTELNALTDYVVESVLNAKRESMKKSRSSISEQELNELYAKAKSIIDYRLKCRLKAHIAKRKSQIKHHVPLYAREAYSCC